MALISQRTNLKSLRYGQDRPGGGDSGQPYIQTSVTGKLIDVNIGKLNVSVPIPNLGILGRGTGGEDFLLRGGTQTPSRALKDVSRLTKMFFDVKSPKGVLFSIKQNLLSLSGVQTQGSRNVNLNEGIYLPTSTIAQAAGNAFGFHLNKQGTNPFRNTSPNSGGIFPGISSPLLDIFGIPAYAQRVKSDQNEVENRLVQLKNAKIITNLSSFPTDEELREQNQRQKIIDRGVRQNQRADRRAETQRAQNAGTLDQLKAQRKDERKQARQAASAVRKTNRANAQNQVRLNIPQNPRQILQYTGGPGSILGFGQTTIRRYSNTNEGVERANEALINVKSPFGKTPLSNALINFIGGGANTGIIPSLFSFPSLTSQFGLPFLKSDQSLAPYLVTNTNEGLDFNKVGNNYTSFDLRSTFGGRYYVLDSLTIRNKTASRDTTQIEDFRLSLLPQQAKGLKKNILARAPSYQDNNIETRVNLGDPGKRNKNTTSYTRGLVDPTNNPYGALDKITAMPLYQSSGVANHKGERNDLVKFSIGIISNDGEGGPESPPLKRTFMHFRAFLDSMDDTYAAEWNDFRYMGRGEKFYRYNGFTRTINLSWTVAAQSKEELIPMYQKLNFLASSLAPDYSEKGYMRGNLAVLTVGGYIYDQPGIINGLTYTVPQESPWEISINDSISSYNWDKATKELPHIIKVTGFQFTPIHKFVPGLQKNKYDGNYGDLKFGNIPNVISEWEKDKGRFIHLSNGSGKENNYDDDEDFTWSTQAIQRRKDQDAKLAAQPH